MPEIKAAKIQWKAAQGSPSVGNRPTLHGTIGSQHVATVYLDANDRWAVWIELRLPEILSSFGSAATEEGAKSSAQGKLNAYVRFLSTGKKGK